MTSIQLLSYVSVVVFLIGVSRTAIKYLSMPIHLRWELYPVAHEKGRDYGGSYHEVLDWWVKPREKSLINELKFMIPEILLIRALFHHNRKLWMTSFPFHAGLYMLVGLLCLLVVGAVTEAFGVVIAADAPNTCARAIYYVTIGFGALGLICAAWGCGRLLFMRFTDRDLNSFTTPLDYINLILVFAVLVCALAVWVFVDPSFSLARRYIQSLITFEPFSPMGWAFTGQIVLFSVLMIYFPFTHMTHFFTKYFTYHKVRWEDAPNIKGSKIETRVRSVLERKVQWAAPHVATGKKWSEIVEEQKSETEEREG